MRGGGGGVLFSLHTMPFYLFIKLKQVFGCSKDLSHKGGSLEYLQLMFTL